MEAIIVFFFTVIGAKVGDKVIDHYLELALEKIDATVADLIKNHASIERIEKEIKAKNLYEPIKELYRQTLKNSIFISKDIAIAPTPDHIVDMVKAITILGFGLANDENLDLMLPGSVLGPNSYAIFYKGQDLSSVLVTDRKLKWEGKNLGLAIVSKPRAAVERLWKEYLATITSYRNSRKSEYYGINHILFSETAELERHRVDHIDASRVFYAYSYTRPEPQLFEDWSGGVTAMLDGIPQVRATHYLSPDDWRKLQDIAKKFAEVASLETKPGN